MRRPALLVVLLSSFAALASAQTSANSVVAARAELIKSFRTNTLKVGDTFFVRTSEPWNRPDCTVPENTTVQGEVTALTRAPGPHKLTLGVRFKPVPCQNAAEPTLLPVLVAMQIHQEFQGDSALKRLSTANLENSTIAGMFGPAASGQPTSMDTMLTSANALSVTNTGGLRPDTPAMKTGEVVGMRGVSLELPKKDLATTLLCPHEETFEGHETTFVLALVPNPTPAPDTAAKDRKPTRPLNTETRRPEAPEETEVCALNGCQQIAVPPAEVGSNAAWSLPLKPLGFQPRPDHLLASLDHSAGVHFLGEDQLLLTFTLHTLIKRPQDQLWASQPRKVRGILLSRDTGRVLRVMDWTVPSDLGPYVWSFGEGRVLAQMGTGLVVFGPDLAVEHRLPLAGPLVFLSVAPHGEQMLLATMHEKHTRQEHQALARYLGPDQPIDENYDLTAVGGDLHVIGSRLLYAQPQAPALFRNDMVTAQQGKQDHWELVSTTWSGQRTMLARMPSSCPVQVSSLSGDLVLARGCVPNQSSFTWYRVLNQKGATVLKGTYNQFDLLEQAASDTAGNLFALATAHFDQPFSFAPLKRAGDFNNLQVSVFSTTGGKPVFAAHLQAGSAEQQTFSLSPSGTTLAVLTSDAVRAYAITPATAPAPTPAPKTASTTL